MNTKYSTILFADIICCSEISNNCSVHQYDGILRQFHTCANKARDFLFPSYTDEQIEFSVKGDEASLILHSGNNIRSSYEDIEKAILMAIYIKLSWLLSKYNQERVMNSLLPRDLGIGIHHGPVWFAEHPESFISQKGKKTSEGFSINLAKRIEGASRDGKCSKIFVSNEVLHLTDGTIMKFQKENESNQVIESTINEGGMKYELKGISTPIYLHEIMDVDTNFILKGLDIPKMVSSCDIPDRTKKKYIDAAFTHKQEFWLNKLIYFLFKGLQDSKYLELMADKRCQEGEAMLNSKKFDLAIKYYKMAAELTHKVEKNEEIFFNVGLAYTYKKRPREAVKSFESAISYNPDKLETWFNKGNNHQALEEYDEAHLCYDRVIKLNPQNAEAYFEKSRVFIFQKDKKRAVDNLKKSFKLDKKYEARAKRDKDFEGII